MIHYFAGSTVSFTVLCTYTVCSVLSPEYRHFRDLHEHTLQIGYNNGSKN